MKRLAAAGIRARERDMESVGLRRGRRIHASFHRPSRASAMMQTLVRATKRTTGFCDSATNCLAGFWQSTRSRIHGKIHGLAGLEPITPLAPETGSRRRAAPLPGIRVEFANYQVRQLFFAAGDGS